MQVAQGINLSTGSYQRQAAQVSRGSCVRPKIDKPTNVYTLATRTCQTRSVCSGDNCIYNSTLLPVLHHEYLGARRENSGNTDERLGFGAFCVPLLGGCCEAERLAAVFGGCSCACCLFVELEYTQPFRICCKLLLQPVKVVRLASCQPALHLHLLPGHN